MLSLFRDSIRLGINYEKYRYPALGKPRYESSVERDNYDLNQYIAK